MALVMNQSSIRLLLGGSISPPVIPSRKNTAPPAMLYAHSVLVICAAHIVKAPISTPKKMHQPARKPIGWPAILMVARRATNTKAASAASHSGTCHQRLHKALLTSVPPKTPAMVATRLSHGSTAHLGPVNTSYSARVRDEWMVSLVTTTLKSSIQLTRPCFAIVLPA